VRLCNLMVTGIRSRLDKYVGSYADRYQKTKWPIFKSAGGRKKRQSKQRQYSLGKILDTASGSPSLRANSSRRRAGQEGKWKIKSQGGEARRPATKIEADFATAPSLLGKF